MEQLEPLTVTIRDACRFTGLGKSTLYTLIDEGVLERRKVGRRTLITMASLKKLVGADEPAEAA